MPGSIVIRFNKLLIAIAKRRYEPARSWVGVDYEQQEFEAARIPPYPQKPALSTKARPAHSEGSSLGCVLLSRLLRPGPHGCDGFFAAVPGKQRGT